MGLQYHLRMLSKSFTVTTALPRRALVLGKFASYARTPVNIGKQNARLLASQSEIAAAAKAHRPLSPHLTHYQPQLTWYMSGLHRATGVGLGLGRSFPPENGIMQY